MSNLEKGFKENRGFLMAHCVQRFAREVFMAGMIVWLDHNDAEVFHLDGKNSPKQHLKKHGRDSAASHAHGGAKIEPHDERYYHEIAQALKEADQILILGPGLAKNHFRTHLEKHYHSSIFSKIVGFENTDKLTDNQILEKARGFFKEFDLFH